MCSLFVSYSFAFFGSVVSSSLDIDFSKYDNAYNYVSLLACAMSYTLKTHYFELHSLFLNTISTFTPSVRLFSVIIAVGYSRCNSD